MASVKLMREGGPPETRGVGGIHPCRRRCWRRSFSSSPFKRGRRGLIGGRWLQVYDYGQCGPRSYSWAPGCSAPRALRTHLHGCGDVVVSASLPNYSDLERYILKSYKLFRIEIKRTSTSRTISRQGAGRNSIATKSHSHKKTSPLWNRCMGESWRVWRQDRRSPIQGRRFLRRSFREKGRRRVFP